MVEDGFMPEKERAISSQKTFGLSYGLKEISEGRLII